MNCITWRSLSGQDSGLSFSLVEGRIQLSLVPSKGPSLEGWPRPWCWAQALGVEGKSCSIVWFPSNEAANKTTKHIISAATLWWKQWEIVNQLLTAHPALLQTHKSLQILATGEEENPNRTWLSAEDISNCFVAESRARHSPAETFRCFRWKSSPVKRSATPHTPRQLPSRSREMLRAHPDPSCPACSQFPLVTPQNSPWAHKNTRTHPDPACSQFPLGTL